MYGFVNFALEKLIKRRFGEEMWQEVHARAAILNQEEEYGTFVTQLIYEDEDTHALIAAAVEILGIDANSILEMFGEQFLLCCHESGYGNVMTLLGHSLMDFLENLDALHDHLDIIYPHMKAPSFRCVEGDEGTLVLHYYSERRGLDVFVQGIVKSVARELYGTEVRVERICLTQEGGQNHAQFLITTVPEEDDDTDGISTPPVSKRLMKKKPSGTVAPLVEKPPIVSERAFCKAFPFHIIFDRRMVIQQMGSRLKKLIAPAPHEELEVTSIFTLLRPRLELSFQNILSHINTIYIMLAKYERPSLTQGDTIRLRGQMIYLNECECMLYVCSPHIRTLQDLKDMGLYISDIPIHDASRALIITEGVLNTEHMLTVQLSHLLEEKDELSLKLATHKEKMKNLLLEIMPFPVASSLLMGQTVEAKEFQCVTVLFSDIVGFTRICQQCKPSQVVKMLNELYCYFDQVLPRNNVYKVETIGDAYMVVGGLLEPCHSHAADACNQALDMLMCCRMVENPTNPPTSVKNTVEVRIGIHSGEVAAGVVGIRMPRYCLFGDTVNVASRTEANSVKGRINVTEWTYVHLKDNPNWVFEARGPVNFKNVAKPVMCYWLIENMERSMQETPTFEHPSDMSLFACLISQPKMRQNSLITDQEDSYPHPHVKADIERLGRPRYDSITGGPPLSTSHSLRTPARHTSRDILLSTMPAFHARMHFDERNRSHSIAGMHYRRYMLPLLSSNMPEPVRDREAKEPPPASPLSRSKSTSSIFLSPAKLLRKISAESNGSHSDLTVPPHKASSMASNVSEQSGAADGGYWCEPCKPEVDLMPTQHQRRTGFDAATMPVSWVKQARATFEKISNEREKEAAKLKHFERTKTLRSQSISPSDAIGSEGLHSTVTSEQY